jgi:hypothetical protein
VTSFGEAATDRDGTIDQWKSANLSSNITAVMLDNDRSGVVWVFLGLVQQRAVNISVPCAFAKHSIYIDDVKGWISPKFWF